MRTSFKIAFLLSGGACLQSIALGGGTLINTNLPTGVEIVNIDATTDGAFGGLAVYNQPFNLTNVLTLGPGTYTFEVVNAADAAILFPTLTSAQLAKVYNAWNYNPFGGPDWVTDGFVFDASDPGASDMFAFGVTGRIPNFNSYTGGHLSGFETADQAYGALKASGKTRSIYNVDRFAGAESTSHTFAKQTTLAFGIPDPGVGDNLGGVSLIVRPEAVPEPASLAASFIGLCGYATRRRKKA